MAFAGVPELVRLVALVLMASAAHGSSAGHSSVRLQGVVSRNATGHWDVEVAMLHGGHRGTPGYEDTVTWGTYDLQFVSVLRNNEPSLQTIISLKGLHVPQASGGGAAQGRGTAANVVRCQPVAEPPEGTCAPTTADSSSAPTGAPAAADSSAAPIAAPTAADDSAASTATTRPHSDLTPLSDNETVSRLRALSPEEKNRKLIAAAQVGALEEERALLSAGADVGARDESNNTALHWAAWRGHTAVVRLLLAASADPNSRDVAGWTPLHEAAGNGKAEAAAALLAAGADRAATSKSGQTALDIARQRNDQRLLQILQQ